VALMSVHVRKENGALIVTGELDLACADEFVESAASLVDRSQELALDLTGVEFMDSDGFRAILRLHDELSVPALVLRHPQKDVLQFLHIISADAVNGIRVEP
jgi:anti-anti-sigma factor